MALNFAYISVNLHLSGVDLLENSMKQAIAQVFTVLAVIFLMLCTASSGNRNSSKKGGLGGEISISGGFPRCGTKKRGCILKSGIQPH